MPRVWHEHRHAAHGPACPQHVLLPALPTPHAGGARVRLSLCYTSRRMAKSTEKPEIPAPPADAFVIAPPVEPMLAKSSEQLPRAPNLLYEPKWDGFRAIVFRGG